MPANDGIRFVDLEQAALGNNYAELAYLRIGFPTCWCAKSVPGPERSQAEAAYHATWRSLTGTGSAAPLADACAGWLITGDALVERAQRGSPSQLGRLPRSDWRWGTATARQRLLHRLGVAADQPDLTNLGTLSQLMRDRLRQDWPDPGPLTPCSRQPIARLLTYLRHTCLIATLLPQLAAIVSKCIAISNGGAAWTVSGMA